MLTQSRFLESHDIVPAIVPVDLGAAANNGDWVNLRDYESVVIVLFKAAGTAGQDPVITLKQAVDASGTSNKALNFTRIDHKKGTLTSVGTFTKMTQTAANTFNGDAGGAGDIGLAEADALVVIEIPAAALDVSNGFTWVQLSVPDTGAAAQVGCGLYILTGGRYRSEANLSAIA